MVKIVKAKDRKPSNAEIVLQWLLDTGGEAKGFCPAKNYRIFITARPSDNLIFLTAKDQHGKAVNGLTDLTVSRQYATGILSVTLAAIPKPDKPSLTASFRQMVSDTKAEIEKRHTSELQAFIGIS